MLDVSPPTVRTWVKCGVLSFVDGARPAEVTVRSLAEVLLALDAVRSSGDERVLRRVIEELGDQRTRDELASRLKEELQEHEVLDPERIEEELFS